MTTILIDGLAVQAAQLACDPLPETSKGPIVLRVGLKTDEAKRFDGAVPIVFPLGDVFYRGQFRRVADTTHHDGAVEHTFISDGPVSEYAPHLWERPLARIRSWRGRRTQ
jgi:hypothetical protein